MREQRSFRDNNSDAGMLYLVPTPIGNLDDITLRALRVLKEADILAAEDTRQTMKLCAHFDIHVPMVSYHEHNKRTRGSELVAELEAGKKVALVTDAGTPGISDPGSDLVASCIAGGIPVVPLPGANAAITGLIASGLPTDHFLFYGFLPRKKKERAETLDRLSGLACTLIFYESPFRIKETLHDLKDALGDRRAALARELTKQYETFLRGTLGELIDDLERNERLKGEICLIVSGSDSRSRQEDDPLWWSALDIDSHVAHYVKTGNMSVKEAIRSVAADRSLPKREVYRIYHRLDE
jgi:16S rRNA (cytidine1402-2'-O)-methyltransferase